MKTQLKIKTLLLTNDNLEEIIEEGFLPIFISRNLKCSELTSKYNHTPIHFHKLSPSIDLYNAWVFGSLTDEEFEEKFLDELKNSVNPWLIYRNLDILSHLADACGIVLLSFDNPRSYRDIVAKFLNNSLDINITEYVTNRREDIGLSSEE